MKIILSGSGLTIVRPLHRQCLGTFVLGPSIAFLTALDDFDCLLYSGDWDLTNPFVAFDFEFGNVWFRFQFLATRATFNYYAPVWAVIMFLHFVFLSVISAI